MWSVSVTLSKLLQLITQFPSFSTLFLSFSFFFFLFSFSFSHLAKKVVSACHSEMTLACHVCFLQTHVKEHFVKAWPAGRCNQQVAEVVWRTNHTIQQSFLFFSFLFFSFLFFSFLFFSFLFFSFVAWLFEKRLFLPFLLDVVARLRCLQTAARKGIRKVGMCTRVCCLNTLQSSFEKRGKPCLSNKLFLSFSFFLSFFLFLSLS